jgi:hypothetical protein
VYALRPCTEEIVRDHVERSYGGDPRPVRPVDYRIEDKRGAGDDITDENNDTDDGTY